MNNLKRVLITIVLLGAAFLAAQTENGTLSLDQARQLALQNNADYQASQADLESAKWSRFSALSNFLPSVSLDGTWLYMDPATTVQAGGTSFTLNNDIRTFSLSLSQPLFLGGKIWQGYQMSKISENMARTSLEAKKLSLLTDVNNLFLSTLQTQDLQKISELDKQSSDLNLQIAQVKYDNSLISSADYLRFQSQAASKEVSLLQAQTALQLARLNLRNYLGLDYLPMAQKPPDSENDAVLLVLDSYGTQESQALVARALELGRSANSSLKLLQNGLELSQRSYSLAKGSFLPTLMLIGSRNYEENGLDRYKFDPTNQIMLTASVPLLPQLGNYANLKKADWQYKKARLAAKTATDGILLGTEAAVLSLVSAAKQLRAAKLALDYTQQSYEQLQERFKMNLISSKDLLDAELMLSSARLANSNAIYNYYKSRVSLMQILSLEEDADLDTLITTGANK